MITFGSDRYYLDLSKIDSIISGDKDLAAQIIEEKEITTNTLENGEVETKEVIRYSHKGKEVDGARFDLISRMIDVVVLDGSLEDETLGMTRAFKEKPFGYRVVFNTLLSLGILVKL